MSFDVVLGQDQAKEFLRSAIERDRVGHAYLFAGPDGVGKMLLARETAKALFCKDSRRRPCDECGECRMVDHGRHPDLIEIEVEEDRRAIGIKQIQDGIVGPVSLRPFQGNRRVAVIREAERMTEEAANSLLKTLEEPPEYATLILTSARPRSLPATIRSRCQEVRFAPLTPEQIERILAARPECDAQHVRLASGFADGSAGEAIRLIESGLIEAYGRLAGAMLMPEEDPFKAAGAVFEWIREASGTLEPQRERLRGLLGLLAGTYRDMLLLRLGVEEQALFNRSRAEVLARTAARMSPSRLMRCVEALWDARRQTDANAALNVVLDNLFVRLADLRRAA